MTVRFVVDAQLPPLLARYLEEQGHEAEHVDQAGLRSATDRKIWDYALARNAALITKDEDFITMRALRAQGPAVIWIRLGNTTRRTLLAHIGVVLSAVIEALDRGETVIEISDQSDE